MALLNLFRTLVLGSLFVIAYFYFPKNRNSESLLRDRRQDLALPKRCLQDGQIALTIDQGVHSQYTPKVMAVLREKGVTATFHITTEYFKVDDFVGSIVKQMNTDGFTVGLAYKNPSALSQSASEVGKDMKNSAELARPYLGGTPKFLRFQYNFDTPALLNISRSNGFVPTAWNIDANDFNACGDSVKLADFAVKQYKTIFDKYAQVGTQNRGSFIAMHSDTCDMMLALSKVIDLGKQYGYKFVSMNECLGIQGRYIDETAPAPKPVSSTQTSSGTAPSPDNNSNTSGSSAGKTGTGTTTNAAPAGIRRNATDEKKYGYIFLAVVTLVSFLLVELIF